MAEVVVLQIEGKQMAIALPLTARGQLVGTAFIAAQRDGVTALVTTLHQLGAGGEFGVCIPPHQGDLSRPQSYPAEGVPIFGANVAIVDHFLDLAVLFTKSIHPLLSPRFIRSATEMKVGEKVMVVGYPYSVIGSVLETVEESHISALGNRLMRGGISRSELVLSRHSYLGSSGSPVVRSSDGVVCGVIRGCLAPPGMLSIGNIPIGTDSSVTYATSAHVLPSLLDEAFTSGVPLP